MFGHCFDMHKFVSREIESWLLFFNCLPDSLLLLIFCGFSSRSHRFVCSE